MRAKIIRLWPINVKLGIKGTANKNRPADMSRAQAIIPIPIPIQKKFSYYILDKSMKMDILWAY